MSDTASQLKDRSADESIDFSPPARALDTEIKRFSLLTARDQRQELLRKKDGVINKINIIDDQEKILLQMILCRAIKPGVFTAYAGAKIAYRNAVLKYNIFLETLRIFDFSSRDNFLKFANKQEKDFLGSSVDELLKGVHENLQPKKGKSVILELMIEQARNALFSVMGAVNERAKEAANVGDLVKEAKMFTKKARDYKINARLFLLGCWGILSLIAFLFFGSKIFSEVPDLLENNLFFNDGKLNVYVEQPSVTIYFYLTLKTLVSTRVLMSFLLVSSFFYCIRFYAANNHNAIICDQRANTLRCFRSLYAASETQNKGLVLEKILESATAHQATGFSKQQSDHGGSNEFSLLSKLLPFLKRD